MNLVDIGTVTRSTTQSSVSGVSPWSGEYSPSLTGIENTRIPTRSIGPSEVIPGGTSDIDMSDSRARLDRIVQYIGSVRFEQQSECLEMVLDLASNLENMLSGPESIFQESSDLTTQINDATDHDEIFNLLEFANHQNIAQRLRYLHDITQNGDPEDPAMEFVSLRELALFFASDDVSLPDPEIGISPDGLLQAEWYSTDATVLMKFLEGNIRFAAMTNDQDEPQAIQDTGSKEHALQSILPFFKSTLKVCPVLK